MHILCETYQSLISERIIDTAQEQPEWPKVLKAEVEKVICTQHKEPYQHKFNVDNTAAKKKWYSTLIIICFQIV